MAHLPWRWLYSSVMVALNPRADGSMSPEYTPYIGSEHTCAVTGYKYQPFHKKVADYLQNAEYPFLYYCRSTPPKSNSTFNRADAEHIMKMKLGQNFMNKSYYFQKVPHKEDTELMISNQFYNSEVQFQWTNTYYSVWFQMSLSGYIIKALLSTYKFSS